MGDWGQVTLFRTEDLGALERALDGLCRAEGLVAAPYARRQREKWDRMQYGTGASCDRWALALGVGRGGWSVVKTAPLELLAEPGGAGEHRLGVLARELRCEALHMSLYDSTAMVIAQAAPTGEVVLSGYSMDGLSFHGVEFDTKKGTAQPWFESSKGFQSLMEQAEKQSRLAKRLNLRLVWHVAEEEFANFLRAEFKKENLNNIDVRCTPPQ